MTAEPSRQPKERLSCRTLPPVIPVAGAAKRAEKLMRLKHHSTGTNHFSSFAALIARRTHLLKPAMGSR